MNQQILFILGFEWKFSEAIKKFTERKRFQRDFGAELGIPEVHRIDDRQNSRNERKT